MRICRGNQVIGDRTNTQIKKGLADDEVLKTMGDSQKKLGNPKDAAATIEQITSHQDKPDENLLQFQWNCYVEAKDDADGVKVLGKGTGRLRNAVALPARRDQTSIW